MGTNVPMSEKDRHSGIYGALRNNYPGSPCCCTELGIPACRSRIILLTSDFKNDETDSIQMKL